MTGGEWTERVCIPGSSGGCMDDFGAFFFDSADNASDLNFADGYVGLGRVEPFETGDLRDLGYERGPSLVKEMMNKGYINESTFSLYLNS